MSPGTGVSIRLDSCDESDWIHVRESCSADMDSLIQVHAEDGGEMRPLGKFAEYWVGRCDNGCSK